MSCGLGSRVLGLRVWALELGVAAQGLRVKCWGSWLFIWISR